MAKMTATVMQIAMRGILDRRMIMSRKQTHNLFDLASLWKKTVLNKLNEAVSVAEDQDNTQYDEEETLATTTQRMVLESNSDEEFTLHHNPHRSPVGWEH